jgi:acetylglutamate kinase
MVLNGSMNTRLTAMCAELGIPAVGLSGVDAGLLRARRRPPETRDGETVDYGFVGDLVSSNTAVLRDLLEKGYLPVVSPLSADQDGTILNVNADTAAARLARELGATKLLLVVGVPGILRDPEDPGSLVSYTDLAGLDALEKNGSLRGGMLPKAASIRDALLGGVERVHVLSSRVADSLLREVFTNEGSGTLVVRSTGELLPEEMAADAAEALVR